MISCSCITAPAIWGNLTVLETVQKRKVISWEKIISQRKNISFMFLGSLLVLLFSLHVSHGLLWLPEYFTRQQRGRMSEELSNPRHGVCKYKQTTMWKDADISAFSYNKDITPCSPQMVFCSLRENLLLVLSVYLHQKHGRYHISWISESHNCNSSIVWKYLHSWTFHLIQKQDNPQCVNSLREHRVLKNALILDHTQIEISVTWLPFQQ